MAAKTTALLLGETAYAINKIRTSVPIVQTQTLSNKLRIILQSLRVQRPFSLVVRAHSEPKVKKQRTIDFFTKGESKKVIAKLDSSSLELQTSLNSIQFYSQPTI